LTLFLAFLVLAIYNAGCMTVLQLQHYGIYSSVGKENFRGYMRANNRAAVLPTILPAVLLLLTSVVLAVRRPGFVRPYEAAIVVALNLVALVSTFLWQRAIHAQMAETGYDETSSRRLVATNWIRTSAHWLIAVLGMIVLTRVVLWS
jgi:fumarate reductase subunit C